MASPGDYANRYHDHVKYQVLLPTHFFYNTTTSAGKLRITNEHIPYVNGKDAKQYCRSDQPFSSRLRDEQKCTNNEFGNRN